MEDWPEFKRVTQELLELNRQGETLKIVELKNSLPDAARDLIIGATHTREAWMILDKRYAGREVAIMTAMRRIMQLKIPSGWAYDKAEALAAKVRTAKRCLKALGAEGELFSSCLTVGTLVNKLDETTQQRWFCYRVLSPRQSKGKSFNDWIKKENEAAIKHRHSVLATKSS